MTAVPASVGAFIWVRLAVESDLSFAVVTAMAVLVVVVATGARSVLHGMGAHHLSNFALAGEAVLRLALIAAAWVAVSTLSPAAGVVLMIVIPPTVTVAAAIPTTMQLRAGRADRRQPGLDLDTPRSGLLLELAAAADGSQRPRHLGTRSRAR